MLKLNKKFKIITQQFIEQLLNAVMKFKVLNVGTSASIIFPCSIKIQKTRGGETQPERSTALC